MNDTKRDRALTDDKFSSRVTKERRFLYASYSKGEGHYHRFLLSNGR